MVDLKLTEKFRVAGGVRFEMTDIGSSVDTAGVFLDPSLTVKGPDGSSIPLNPINPNSVHQQQYKPYYSVNATYTLNSNMNFRAAYNTTLARPELREITNIFEFDAFQMGLVVGNPDLIIPAYGEPRLPLGMVHRERRSDRNFCIRKTYTEPAGESVQPEDRWARSYLLLNFPPFNSRMIPIPVKYGGLNLKWCRIWAS